MERCFAPISTVFSYLPLTKLKYNEHWIAFDTPTIEWMKWCAFFLLIQIGVFFSICEQAKFNFDGISNVQMA